MKKSNPSNLVSICKNMEENNFGRKINSKATYKTVSNDSESIILSYLGIKKIIGLIGLALPAILWGITLLQQEQILPTISNYYYTKLFVFFTGLLIVLGIFLITSHSKDKWERRLCVASGLSAILIALIPTNVLDKYTIDENSLLCANELVPSFHRYTDQVQEEVSQGHLIAAFIFFITIIVLTKIFHNQETKCKGINVQTYFILFLTLLIVFIILILLIICREILGFNLGNSVFYLESIMLILFGVTWLIRGGDIRENWFNISKGA